MLIVSQLWYPVSKAPDVGKLYIEMRKKIPDDKTVAKPIIRTAIRATKDGLHNITIASIKPGKVKEALDLTHKRLLMFGAIEGIKYETYIAYDLGEAMPLIGLQAPSE